MKKKMKRRYIVLLTVVSIVIAAVLGFLSWTAFYYHADDTAVSFAQNDSTLINEGSLTILPEEDSSRAVIFYPGAKVEAIAYLPILEQIREEAHVTCILVHMPLNLAFFNVNAADQIIEDFPDIKTWYLAGHSLGGAMASSYAAKHQDKLQGLILMGAYIYGDYPAEKALTIYGSLNTQVEAKINYTENVVRIEGGNHAQFGNYGKQKGDADAVISAAQQQKEAVEAITSFINTK
jgi:hypothetical protein